MLTLIDRVQHAITRHTLIDAGERVIVAVSGGPDSLVLLHALHTLNRYRLHVATLDHGLRGAAGAADAAFVRETAIRWGLPVTVGRADVLAVARDHRLGLEGAARQVRYTFLVRAARAVGAGKIAVGHTQDDQAETVLMHLIRGSGISGLRGMRPAAPTGPAHWLDGAAVICDPPLPDAPGIWPVLVRPLLDVSRAEIDAYAAAHDLNPRADATNADRAYVRNRLRHDVIPLLETLNPNLRATLARTADILREDETLIRAAGDAALARVQRDSPPGVVILDRAGWDALSPGEQRAVIRAAVRRLRPDLHDLAFDHVVRAIDIVNAPHDFHAAAALPGGVQVRELPGALVISPPDAWTIIPGEDAPALLPGTEYAPFSPGDTVTQVCGAWVFEARPLADDLAAIHADPLAAALVVPVGTRLRLRARRPGDRFQPRGMGGHSQKLVHTLAAMKVPAAWRDRVPLLDADGVIAWFVAPGVDGLRGRVADPLAVPDSSESATDPSESATDSSESATDPSESATDPPASHAEIVVVRWRRRNI